jgi:NAD(P)-dependent dehydrogenase (short-subunit alcohol dehydrogenase family)
MKKAVVITGAGTGIGAASALEFSKSGYFVFLLGRRLEKLQEVATRCQESQTIVCDVADSEQVKKAAAQIRDFSGTVQTLVNNAGIFERKSFEESDDGVWMRQFEINFFGAVRLTRELFPYFKSKKSGYIVNVSSTLGLKPSAETAAYSSSKAAMINWTQSLALSGGPFGIRANCICPGLVDTPIHAPHSLEKLNHLQPLGRVGTPEDLAQSIYFLGTELSSWTTGAVLSVDGGINLT